MYVCMCVCLCTHVCVCVSVYMLVYEFVCTFSCVCIYVCVYVCLVAQLCLTLCDPMDYVVHGILQATILEWVAFPFFRESSQPKDQTQISCIAGRFFIS